MSKRALLVRLQSLPDRMLGALYIFNGLFRLGQFTVLEPPWKNNRRGESCIPTGDYTLSPRAPTKKFNYPHLLLGGVPDRDFILAHRGNFPSDTEGCLLLGLSFGSADGDGLTDVLSSTSALNVIVQMIPDPIPLKVVDLTGISG
jgi:hypothetical protein